MALIQRQRHLRSNLKNSWNMKLKPWIKNWLTWKKNKPKQMSQEVIINVGVSGAGKTTWSINYIRKHPKFVRINRDDIRKILVGDLEGYYQVDKQLLAKRENYVSSLEELLFVQHLSRGFSVIIDNTHLKPSYIQKWIDFTQAWNEGKEPVEDVLVKFKLFLENHSFTLKQRVAGRDKHKIGDVAYIDKQVSSIRSAIAYVEDNY